MPLPSLLGALAGLVGLSLYTVCRAGKLAPKSRAALDEVMGPAGRLEMSILIGGLALLVAYVVVLVASARLG